MFNINTRLVTNEDTQNGPHESWQVETPSRVGKSRCYSCFLVLLSCIGEWLHDARCFHLEGCHQRGKLLLCAPDMLHPFELGSGLIYRDLPWLTDCSLEVRGWNAARVRYLNQSTWLCRPQVGQMALLVKKSVSYKLRSYPSANLWNPKLKAGVTEVHWSVKIKQPLLSLSDSQALQINGANRLLLQADWPR